MELLERKIQESGKILPGNVVKVDSFLNHQIDTQLLQLMAYELKQQLYGIRVDKVLTIEASGIAFASFVAQAYGVNFVFAKKNKASNISNDFYSASVYSYTHQVENNIIVSKEFLHEGENILIVDDFLANGCAMNGLISLVNQAKGNVVAIGVAVEKGFQEGGKVLRQKGYNLHSLAIIDSIDMEHQLITFGKND